MSGLTKGAELVLHTLSKSHAISSVRPPPAMAVPAKMGMRLRILLLFVAACKAGLVAAPACIIESELAFG